MEKRVEPLEIKTTTDGMIDLTLEEITNDEAAVIRIHPDQVEQVIHPLSNRAETPGNIP